MPRYDFRCAKCGHAFTIERHMAERAKVPSCPKCKSATTEQQFTPFYPKTIKKS